MQVFLVVLFVGLAGAVCADKVEGVRREVGRALLCRRTRILQGRRRRQCAILADMAAARAGPYPAFANAVNNARGHPFPPLAVRSDKIARYRLRHHPRSPTYLFAFLAGDLDLLDFSAGSHRIGLGL